MYQTRRQHSKNAVHAVPSKLNYHPKRRAFLFIAFLGIIGFLTLNHVYAAMASNELRFGINSNCLQANGSGKSNISVSVGDCSGNESQDWTTTDTTIQHGINGCLAVQSDGVNVGDSVVMNLCSTAPGQVWLRDQTGYLNPNSGLCLSGSSTGSLTIQNCNTASQTQTWTPYDVQKKTNITNSCNSLLGSAKVACYAISNWNNWQSPTSDHNALLNTYSDGNGYESWCADFVSYIYKQAGYALTNGERSGWDEYEADLLQYDGFTVHMAGNYVPKVGDIAYFNYPGGHVELVVSGGSKPTYVYGDSAKLIPKPAMVTWQQIQSLQSRNWVKQNTTLLRINKHSHQKLNVDYLLYSGCFDQTAALKRVIKSIATATVTSALYS